MSCTSSSALNIVQDRDTDCRHCSTVCYLGGHVTSGDIFGRKEVSYDIKILVEFLPFINCPLCSAVQCIVIGKVFSVKNSIKD